MGAALFSGLVTALGVAGFLVAERRGLALLAWVAKPIASTGFFLAALQAGAASTPHGKVLLVALALSWIGDVLLIAKGSAAFLGGLGSFLLAHVAFAVSFALRGASPTFAAGLVAILMVPATIVWRWLGPHLPPSLKLPVAAYVAAITVMVGIALATSRELPSVLLAMGALGFYASDISVARDKFVAPGLVNRLWGVPLYYGAQLLMAWSGAT